MGGRGGRLLTAKLLELCDDHLAAVAVAVQQGQELAEHCEEEGEEGAVS